MKRVFVIIAILVRSALRGLQSSAVTSSIAVITIGIALFLVGIFALLIVNMQGLMDRFGDELQITAYLSSGQSEEEQRDLTARIMSVEGVETATLVSEVEALERFQASVGGAALLEGLDENPLPASVEIVLRAESRTPEGLAILSSSLDGLVGIAEVAHGQEWIDGYARVASLARTGAFVLGTVLSLAALLIVANTIRLGVYAREEELEILSLVGASRTFVRVPFLLEGTLQGVIGGIVALALLFAAFQIVVPQLQYGLSFFLGRSDPRFFETTAMLRLVMGGAGLGLLGSMAALMGWRGAA